MILPHTTADILNVWMTQYKYIWCKISKVIQHVSKYTINYLNIGVNTKNT